MADEKRLAHQTGERGVARDVWSVIRGGWFRRSHYSRCTTLGEIHAKNGVIQELADLAEDAAEEILKLERRIQELELQSLALPPPT